MATIAGIGQATCLCSFEIDILAKKCLTSSNSSSEEYGENTLVTMSTNSLLGKLLRPWIHQNAVAWLIGLINCNGRNIRSANCDMLA